MKLKLSECPNPWCNSINVSSHYTSLANKFYVLCSECRNTTQMHLSEAEAIEAWNNRPFEDKAVEVVAEKCYYNSELWDENRDMPLWEDIDEHIKTRCRAEAKQLLGVKE